MFFRKKIKETSVKKNQLTEKKLREILKYFLDIKIGKKKLENGMFFSNDSLCSSELLKYSIEDMKAAVFLSSSNLGPDDSNLRILSHCMQDLGDDKILLGEQGIVRNTEYEDYEDATEEYETRTMNIMQSLRKKIKKTKEELYEEYEFFINNES